MRNRGEILALARKYIRNPHLWAIAIIVVLLTLVHYHELFGDVQVLGRIGSIFGLGLTRHTLERILLMLPVVYGTIVLGVGAGISLAILTAAAMLPRVFLVSPAPREAIFETMGVIFTSAILVSLLHSRKKSAERLIELEATQSQLNSHIHRLSMLHAISALSNQSLELNKVIDAVLAKVARIMDSPVAWLYLWGEEKNRLKLFAQYGLSSGQKDVTLEMDEDADGQALKRMKPVVVEENTVGISGSSVLTRQGIKSELVVPLIAKGKAIGTLGVGHHSPHQFAPDEIDLLTAVADQFSMTIENSYLYQKERSAAEELRVSERNYRDIFENASDAIWTHDLDGITLAANDALCRLTGFEKSEIVGHPVHVFLPDYGRQHDSHEAHSRALESGSSPSYLQTIVKKDGTEVIVQMGTSIITRAGRPWAYQHIARDVTEEKRTQDNLRMYVQRVSQAQEAERLRISRELHDDTAQALVVISRHLEALNSGDLSVSPGAIRDEVRRVLEGVRHFSQELRPSILDDLGLLSALEWLAQDVKKTSGIEADVCVNGSERQLPPEAELMLFRITQEALTNVRKHAKATKVVIKIDYSGHRVKLAVHDNGKGFQMPSRVGDLTQAGKLGLAGMTERAELLGGELHIESQPGKGTLVSAEVPL